MMSPQFKAGLYNTLKNKGLYVLEVSYLCGFLQVLLYQIFGHSSQTFEEVTITLNEYWLEATKDKWSEGN